ncbi:MAG: hypothetical protein WBO24_04620 [Nitrospirales bacterium]
MIQERQATDDKQATLSGIVDSNYTAGEFIGYMAGPGQSPQRLA